MATDNNDIKIGCGYAAAPTPNKLKSGVILEMLVPPTEITEEKIERDRVFMSKISQHLISIVV